MYEFIDNIAEKEYMNFFHKNNASFMQSYNWGQFNRSARNQIPHYVGLKKNNKIVCEALLLEKKILKLSYFYCPRGFIIDFNNKDTLNEFTKHLKKYIKSHNGIYLKIDPEIEYQKLDKNGNVISSNNQNDGLLNNLQELGFTHTGFNKNFENNQPRYTFIIDLTSDIDTIINNIDKSVLKKIKKTYEYDMIFRESQDIDTFYKLISKVSEKDEFSAYSKKYYQDVLNIMDEYYKLFEIIINPHDLYQKLQNKLDKINMNLEYAKSKELNNLKYSKERIIKELNILKHYKDIHKLVICSQICACTKEKMYTLYIGNDEIGQQLYAVNRMYLEIIKYAKNNGYKYLDLFGTTGDEKTAVHNLSGIHKFKQNFGGEYVEFIGEFDYVNKKALYHVLPIFLKIYRLGLKKKNNWRKKHESL